MECAKCKFYEERIWWNHCMLTCDEYFKTQEHCPLVNEDNTVNYNDSYFKNDECESEYRENEEE